jgi:hypothetical protein
VSYDLEIYGPRWPSLESAVSALRRDDLITVRAAGHGEDAGLTLMRRVQREERYLCTADGPFEVDDRGDDVPDSIRASLLHVALTVQISGPVSQARADSELVERFARAVADEGAGVLYNPQTDQIVWPRNVKKLRDVPAAAQRSDEHLALEWLMARNLVASDGDALLDVLGLRMPEALPRRFGTFEPLQGALDRDGRAAFTSLLDDVHLVIWKGRPPLQWGFAGLSRGWGSALTPAERDARTPMIGGRKAVMPDYVALEFEPAIAGDERWLEAVKSLFRAVAEELQPFFAAASFRPASPKDRVRLAGRYWLGIPEGPLWLVWIGKPYLPFAPAGLPDDCERTRDHIFVSASGDPRHLDELQANAIGWDRSLQGRGGQLDEKLAAEHVPRLN